MKARTTIALLACALLVPLGGAAPAHAERALENPALLTGGPPPEGQIEGACGLSVRSSSLYVSDYYHRVIDLFSTSGTYQSSQIVLGGGGFDLNPPDSICGLAFDASGTLYGNEFHERAVRLRPSFATIDEGKSTGVAVDAATGDLYVDDRTYVAEYEAPVEEGDEPVAKIGEGSLEDGYGLAVFEGKVYVPDAGVPDAGDDAVKLYEPSTSLTTPVKTIVPTSPGFTTLADAAAAVDPTNGHLLVVDNAQPGYEHPLSNVYEFEADGTFLGTLKRAEKSGGVTGPRFGEPSGIAVDPEGHVYVTDGNSELANAFKYGPYTASASPVTSSTEGEAGGRASAASLGHSAAQAPAATASRRRSGSSAVRVQRGPVQVSVEGKLTPRALPRHGRAPVGIALAVKIVGTGKGSPPQLRRIAIEINRNGRFDTGGLPSCRLPQIEPSTTNGALAACRGALVGEGHFAANIKLPQQSPFPSSGKVLAFNGRVHGKPAILAHIYGTQPAPTSYVLPFMIRSKHGTYGNVLEASLPQATGNWGYVTGLRMNLHRTFRRGGARRSYLSAGCPAPAGFPAAVFPLARTKFSFAGGMSLAATLERNCRARG